MGGKYRAYSEYRDSEVSGLGAIPSHWEVMQLKRTVDGCVNGIWGSEPKKDGHDMIVLRVADFDRPKLSLQDDGYTYRKIEDKEKTTRKLKRGDLLLEKSGGGEKTLVGQVVLFDKEFEAVTSNFVAKMTPNDGFNSKFLNYVFSRFYSDNINYCSIKQNTGIQNLDSAAYLAEKFGFPLGGEQQKIANFLGHETAKIDTLIEKQQQLIKLLKEKRQAVISHAVKILEGENRVKLSYLVELLSGFAFPSSGFKGDSPENIKLLRGANVGVGGLKWEEVVYWPKKDIPFLKDFILVEGDIVFGMDRPWISTGARVAEVKEADLPCLLLQRVARIRTGSHAYQPYVKLCLQSEEFRAFVESDLTGVSVPHISPDQIKSFSIRGISYSEQETLYADVRNKLDKIQETIVQAESLIGLLQERRTALISAAVTGKIDVRSWKEPVTEKGYE